MKADWVKIDHWSDIMTNNPTVCLACLHNEDDAPFMGRFLEMIKYDWITTGVAIKTDSCLTKTCPTTFDGKLQTSIHGDYGSGFDKRPKDGGFHALRARNDLMRAAEDTGCDWILLADPDELFRDETYVEIQTAHKARKTTIWFECYHFCTPDQYVWWQSTTKQIHGSRRMLHDPHARAVRSSSRSRYVSNVSNQYRKRLRNYTVHCHLGPQNPRDVHIAYGIYHIHTRHMFDPKRPSQTQLAEMDKKTAPMTLPQSYVDAFDSQ